MSTVEWRRIPGYPDYEVSDQGRVRSWKPRNGPHGLILRQLPNARGYMTVRLSRPGGVRTKRVHSLVLLAFVGPRPDGLQTRHMDVRVNTPKSVPAVA